MEASRRFINQVQRIKLLWLEQKLRQRRLSVETYYKTLRDLVDFKNGAQPTGVDNIEVDLATVVEAMVLKCN